LHFQRGNDREALDLVQNEINVAEGGQPRVAMALGLRHAFLLCHIEQQQGE
jgi:hypothetical protein